jgi:excisionase family DNA binding protein
MNTDRLDASLLNPGELNQLADLITREDRPALIGREGVRIDLPDPIFHLLVRVIRIMREGRAVVLLPEDETFTTQATADFLGMSRQFLVQLLEKGEIPFHYVGTHHRIYFKDLLAYQKKRDQARRQKLDQLFTEADAAEVYDKLPHAKR